MPRASLRAGVALVLALVALLEVLSLLQGVHSVRRLQARVVEQADAAPGGGPAAARGWPWRGGAARRSEATAALAVRLGVAAEADVLDRRGRSLRRGGVARRRAGAGAAAARSRAGRRSR